MKRAKEIIASIVDEGEGIVEQIEEVNRLGKYVEKGVRPMKIRFCSQVAAETVLAKSWKLAEVNGMKEIWLRRDLNEEERSKQKELRDEVRAKNEARTQEEMSKFVWKLKDMRIRKWWLREASGETHR